jgi:hypothetical protein
MINLRSRNLQLKFMDDDQCSLPTPPLHSGGTYNVAMIGRTIYDCLQYKKSFESVYSNGSIKKII